MKEYRLDEVGGFISPRWFAATAPRRWIGVVGEDGFVLVDGIRLAFRGEDRLPAGTAVEVWVGRFIVCMDALEAERERRAAEERRRAKEDAVARADRERRNALRAEAEAFNANLRLPVAWDVGIKDVPSGLSGSSWGDGRSQATVEHIVLLEDLAEGRLRRKMGDFLCASSARTNGKRWSGQVIERHVDGDGKKYQPMVTCRNCLRIVDRLRMRLSHDRIRPGKET